MIKPAIVAVGYNRPDSMKRLLQSVCAADYPCDGITLIVSIDQCEMSDSVEAAARSVEWTHGPLCVVRYPERQGLRNHILHCGDFSQEYGAVIILEDDLWVAPSFYKFAMDAVDRYHDDEKLAGIALYSHSWNGYAGQPFLPARNGFDAYFGQFSITWGQCWTSEQWSGFRNWYQEHEDRLPADNYDLPASISDWGDRSWGKYFVSYIVEKDLYYLVPYASLSTNFSELGEHNSRRSTIHQVPLMEASSVEFRFPDFSDAIKYDVFFERIFSPNHIVAGISGSEIACDFYASKRRIRNKPYLLSAQNLPYKKLATFGLELRPIEANALQGVAGNDLFLYKLSEGECSLKPARINRTLANYYLYGFNWRVLAGEFFPRFMLGVHSRLKRLLHR